MNSNIVLQYKKDLINMFSVKIKNKTQNLSFKLAPYFFIAVAIFTAFGSNNGAWV